MTPFFYLNTANGWPDVVLGPGIANENGDLVLAKPGAGYVRSGAFLGGPFTVGADPVQWFRLRVFADPLAQDEHIEVFTLASDAPLTPVNLSHALPFDEPKWHRAPRDLTDVLIPGRREHPRDPLLPGQPARQLWIGGVLRGNESSSPRIHQIRVEYGRDTSIRSLPAVYGRDAASRERLERLLALNEWPFADLDEVIEDLPRLFDPAASPAGPHPAWLPWLAAWLDFDLTDRWTEAQTRELLAAAFDLYGRRGTIEGLRRYLKIYAGVDARITEPAASARLWVLGETSTLGFTTQLASAAAGGAVLDATATLDASHLTRGEHFGATLFEDVAHRFCVDVYCADLRRPHALDEVRAVLDREKPAHTVYGLRVIGARMRVGLQAQIGIDTIVANRQPDATLDGVLGNARLADTQTECKPLGDR